MKNLVLTRYEYENHGQEIMLGQMLNDWSKKPAGFHLTSHTWTVSRRIKELSI